MRQLGDEAFLLDVEGGWQAAQALARTLTAREVIPAATTVGVVGHCEVVDSSPPPPPPRRHEVPIALDGEDVDGLGITARELAGLLEGCELRVAYLGFMPGFAYLDGLPDELSSLERRPHPRPRVPPGSLAVAGGYAGIYPSASPGGWHLLGHTNLRLFDPESPPYALFQPGDTVTFRVCEELAEPPRESRPLLEGDAVEVVDPGPLSLVQDLGRRGAGALGVPRAGAFNSCWARILNRAVGNDESAALIESAGPLRLLARRPLLVAVGGAELRLGGTGRPSGIVASVAPGEEVELGPPRHRRSYLAVAGGLAPPAHFESRSSDAISGLAPGPLQAEDALSLEGTPGRPRLRFQLPLTSRPCRLRILDGPDGALGERLPARWRVGRLSDRTGLRLEREGEPLEGGTITSHAVVPGSVQLPPGGSPILLGPDCGPVGGYPVVATVITADLWQVASLEAGDEVSFERVELHEAVQAAERLSDLVEQAVSGWFPTAFA